MGDLQQLTEALIKFRDQRDWEQFHNPKDLAMAINIEASELLELFLWKSPDEADKEKVKDELADILSFAILMGHRYDLDLKQTVLDKIEQNARRYPADKAMGNAKKYNELEGLS